MNKITKLVLPVAGMGKRLLPLTEKTPKGLVGVGGKPLLEYVLEEALESGIKEVVLIVNPLARSNFELYLSDNSYKFSGVRFHIREQVVPGGNGHAIVQAYDLLDEPFVVRFCDDIILSDEPITKGLMRVFEDHGHPVVLLEAVPRELVHRFGVVGLESVEAGAHAGEIHRITKIVEKPKPHEAPSNFIIIGGYVLTPEIIHSLKMVSDTLPNIADDALPLAVALQISLILKNNIYGWKFPGTRLDCGTIEKLKEAEVVLEKLKSDKN